MPAGFHYHHHHVPTFDHIIVHTTHDECPRYVELDEPSGLLHVKYEPCQFDFVECLATLNDDSAGVEPTSNVAGYGS